MKILPRNQEKRQQGFIMPTIIILMSIMAFVAYATLLQASNGLNLSYKQAYIQMARVASKAAVDYAQEQFDNSACGNYTGTSEQDLVSNNRYRLTFKSEVLSTSSDGFEKTIRGTGSVYLPRYSNTARYVFDIRSEIVRTYAVCKTPDNFAPLVWLDASDTATLKHINSGTNTVSVQTSFGNAADSTRDTLEERQDDGSQTTNSWQSSDLEMHRCDSAEFSSSICSSNTTRFLYTGIVFQNVNIPKNATIVSANILFNGGTPAGTSGPVTHRVYGIFKNSGNPHPNLFSQSGSNQLRTPLTTANLHTSAFSDVSTNNFPPGNTTSFDVTSVVQELINNTNWNAASNDGRMGFGIQYQSGNGSRRGLKNGITLNITYSAGNSVVQANNGESIGEWHDKSGHQYHAKAALGSPPTRVDNQINGKTVVRFSNGNLLSTIAPALTGKREMTVLAVMKPNFSTSGSDGRVVSGMTSSGSNDTTAGNSIIPLLRYGGNSGFSNLYSGSNSAYRTDYSCGSSCNNLPYLFASAFTIDTATNKITSILKGNGTQVATKTGINPSGSPYTFGLDQLYFGGRRNGAMPGSGADYFNGDYAELIVYDTALTCRQIESLEDYLRSKWSLSANQYTDSCPADQIPTL